MTEQQLGAALMDYFEYGWVILSTREDARQVEQALSSHRVTTVAMERTAHPDKGFWWIVESVAAPLSRTKAADDALAGALS